MIANPGIPAYRYGQPTDTRSGPRQPHGGEHPSSPSTPGTSCPHRAPQEHPPPRGWAGSCLQRAQQAGGCGVGEEARRGDGRQSFTPAEYKHFDKYLRKLMEVQPLEPGCCRQRP